MLSQIVLCLSNILNHSMLRTRKYIIKYQIYHLLFLLELNLMIYVRIYSTIENNFRTDFEFTNLFQGSCRLLWSACLLQIFSLLMPLFERYCQKQSGFFLATTRRESFMEKSQPMSIFCDKYVTKCCIWIIKNMRLFKFTYLCPN